MELGKRLAEIRKQNNMTQEDLAEKLHVTRQTISNWETGKSYPDLETLVYISDNFNISLDAMLKGDKEMVKKITSEQFKGRKQHQRLVVAVFAALIIVAALLFIIIINNTVTHLNPENYNITVKEITFENVTVNEAKETATYREAKGESASQAEYVYKFEDEEYDRLMEHGKAYKIVITTNKSADGYMMSLGKKENSLALDVWCSNSKIFKPNKPNQFTTVWCEEFDKIYDYSKGDLVWNLNFK